MKLARIASWTHKWLALIVGVQVLFWFASGLFFALSPIERVRSEHRIRETHAALSAADIAATARIATPPGAAKLTLEARESGPVLIAEYHEGRGAFFDVRSGARLSPLDRAGAEAIARAHVIDPGSVREARLVTEGNAEYRGALPAWRVQFGDSEGLAIYVAADTGRVTARRSDLWRVYDALWALHIMDWRDHENFNTGLLIVTTALALLMALWGVVLLPYRLLSRRAQGASE
ncbi:MAG: hypothetical protein AB7J28_05810 [Hyphomonadaceae bacterium]